MWPQKSSPWSSPCLLAVAPITCLTPTDMLWMELKSGRIKCSGNRESPVSVLLVLMETLHCAEVLSESVCKSKTSFSNVHCTTVGADYCINYADGSAAMALRCTTPSGWLIMAILPVNTDSCFLSRPGYTQSGIHGTTNCWIFPLKRNFLLTTPL